MWLIQEKTKKQRHRQRGRMHLPINIANAIIRRQLQVAAYLERKTQYWNKTSKITALVIFCLVFGGFSIYLLLKAIL